MTDQAIIELYWRRDEAAIIASDEKYGRYCLAVAGNILPQREDAEECVNDTWLRAWQAMPPEKPRILQMFFARITRNLAISRWRALHAERRGGGEIALVLDELRECLPADREVEDTAAAREMLRTLNRLLGALPERERGIFLRRYFFAEPTAQIAARYHITTQTALVILSRTRKRLRNALEKEGFAP